MFKAYFRYRKLLKQIYKCKTTKEFNQVFEDIKVFLTDFENYSSLCYNLSNRWRLQVDLYFSQYFDETIRKM